MTVWCRRPTSGSTFAGDHKHYLTTNSTVLDATDVEGMIKHVTEHGYGTPSGAQLLILANPLDVEASGITAWRAGQEYRRGQLPEVGLHPERADARLDL